MNATEAIERAFDGDSLATQLVKRLLCVSANSTPSNWGRPAIVVFTGYGERLAQGAASVASSHGLEEAPIWILGPDSIGTCARPDANAHTYCQWMIERHRADAKRIIADARLETQSTPGQSKVAARMAECHNKNCLILIAAAYHLPRAYMTLVQALAKEKLDERTSIVPRPGPCPYADWAIPDPTLHESHSWAEALRADEQPRIAKYQKQGDVASWESLRAFLDRWDPE